MKTNLTIVGLSNKQAADDMAGKGIEEKLTPPIKVKTKKAPANKKIK